MRPHVDVGDRLRKALDTEDPALALQDLARRVGASIALKELGMPEAGVGEAADRALANPYWNPRPLDPDEIRGLICRAWAGDVPETDHGR